MRNMAQKPSDETIFWSGFSDATNHRLDRRVEIFQVWGHFASKEYARGFNCGVEEIKATETD